MPAALPAEATSASVDAVHGFESSIASQDPVAQAGFEAARKAEDFWARLRQDLHWPSCEATPQIQSWMKRYAARPDRFAQTLKPIAPMMAWVHRQAEAHGLPGEVVFLPLVESYYRPDARGPGGASGMWQFMADTARRLGLRVGAGWDERMDVVPATDAAMRMLRQQLDAFDGNPKLMFAAYNAGGYRVQKALGGRDYASVRSLSGLGLTRTTEEHMAKLRALGCLVIEAERIGLHLPVLTAEDELAVWRPPFPIAPEAVLALGEEVSPDFRRRHPTAVQRRAIAPESGVLVRARWAPRLGAEALAGNWTAIEPRNPKPVPVQADPGAKVHIVRAGDSLWTIARAHRLRVKDLLRWNDLRSQSLLRIGQRIRLQAP